MRTRVGLAAAVGGALLATVFALAATADPGSQAAWKPVAESCGSSAVTGSQGAVRGPGTPPAGVGSYRFEIGSNGDTYRTLRSAHFTGKRLSALNTFTYWTYVSSFGTGGQAPYIDLRVDLNGDGNGDDTLTFEPIYQTGGYSGDPVPNQGAVALNTWQRWNAAIGGWWSDKAGNSGPPLVTLAHYVADHPGAKIIALRLSTGCGGAAWANFVGYLDKVTVGVGPVTRTYDFEPASTQRVTHNATRTRKVAMCHNGHTIRVDRRTVPAHIRHGDTVGACKK